MIPCLKFVASVFLGWYAVSAAYSTWLWLSESVVYWTWEEICPLVIGLLIFLTCTYTLMYLWV